MVLICIFCLALYAFFANFCTHSFQMGKLSLINVFTYFWLIVVTMGAFHLYGLYHISDYVYLIVTVGSGCFVAGYYLFGYFIRANRGEQQVNNECIIGFKPTYYVLLGFAIILICMQVALLLPLILRSGMAIARHEWAEDQTLHLTGAREILISYFAKPFIKASLFIMIISLFLYGIQKTKICLMALLGIVYFFSEGGRSFIMDLFFVFCYLFYCYRKSLDEKVISAFKKIILVVALMPILATLQRGSGLSGIFYGIYTYYCGSLQYFTQLLETKSSYFADDLYGMASFQGFVKPFFGILNQLGVEKPDLLNSANNFIIKVQQLNLVIAPQTKMNYFASCFGYAYRDGKMLGVIFDMFIYGAMCAYVDKKESDNMASTKWLAIKVLFFSNMFFLMSYMPFSKYLNGMLLIFILIIANSKLSKKYYV